MQTIHTKHQTIGLLGGSFNPAHAGHLHISQEAIKRLHLDAVWWLVSPHNPLKAKNELAPYSQRLRSAQEMAVGDRRIVVSDIEEQHSLYYTYQTIRFLKRRFPGARFVWLMGADNLAGFHHWQHWVEISNHVPLAVFDRAPYSHTALRSPATLRLRKFLRKSSWIWPKNAAPSLMFLHIRRDAHSATMLRKTLGKRAFLGHNKTVRCE